MTQHTPGPWVIGLREDQTIFTEGLRRVATVEGARKDWRANARLIAAAPDMLAALEDIRDYIDDPNMPMRELLARVSAAIAQAKGAESCS